MKIIPRMLLLGMLMTVLSLPLTYRAYAMSQITLQNNTDFSVNLYLDNVETYGCGPVMPGGYCATSIKPGGHWLYAIKTSDKTVIDQQWMDIADGASPVWSTKSIKAELDIPRAQQAIMSFYQSRGEWAGVFVMDSIMRIKSEKLSDRSYRLNVEYHYTPIPNNRMKRTDSGVDQRVFTMEVFDGNYTITSMGGHQSAQF